MKIETLPRKSPPPLPLSISSFCILRANSREKSLHCLISRQFSRRTINENDSTCKTIERFQIYFRNIGLSEIPRWSFKLEQGRRKKLTKEKGYIFTHLYLGLINAENIWTFFSVKGLCNRVYCKNPIFYRKNFKLVKESDNCARIIFVFGFRNVASQSS